MDSQPRKSSISFTADQPMKISDVDTGQAGTPPNDAQKSMIKQVASTIKAYLDAAGELLNGPYSQLRDIAPIHLRDPGNVLVACCVDGVVIRYERKTAERKIMGAWFSENISNTASLVSQALVHCYPVENPPPSPPRSGVTLELAKRDTEGKQTGLFKMEIGFFIAIQSPKELPPPPNKPYCLLSIYNELEIQLAGELLQEGKSHTAAQPFIVRSLFRLPVGWECIEVFPFFNPDHWKPEYAKIWAERDLLAAVLRRQTREAEFSSLDPNVAARNRFRKLLKDYKDLLDSEPEREETLHQFLRDHPALLHPVHTRFWSKLSLGNKVTDFVFLEATGDYLLVELEKSTHTLFRNDGHPKEELNLARGQIVDWKRYLEDNLATVQRELGLTGISSNPKSLIVIGRTKSLTAENRRKLAALESESPKIKILTYDDVLENAKAVIENLLGPLMDVEGRTEVYYPSKN